MLRLRFLAKIFSRSYSKFKPQRIAEQDIIDMKFSKSKSLDSFLSEIDVSKTSLSMLSYTLKVAKDYLNKDHTEVPKKLFEVRNAVISNIDKLDLEDIANFSKWLANSNIPVSLNSLQLEKKRILALRINELIRLKSFERKQVLLIYENLAPTGLYIEELETEVEKIINSPLTLEEISQIFTGFGRYIYSKKRSYFFSCMERIFNMNKEELNGKYLAKILDTLKNEHNIFTNNLLSDYAKLIENTLPRWKENELLSIIKFYNSHAINPKTYFYALEIINKLLANDQPIEFLIELASLLKNDSNSYSIISEIVSKSLIMIKEKLPNELMDFKNLKAIIGLMSPIIEYQTALALSDQINSKRFLIWENMEIFQKASWICVNKEGKLFPLTDLISDRINYSKVKDLKIRQKFDILANIILTKNYSLNAQHEIKELLMEDIKKIITVKDSYFKLILNTIYDREYNSSLAKALKPLQNVIFGLLKKNPTDNRSLILSMMFYESDPERWEDFVIENKNYFSHEAVSAAIRFYQGPFEAIIFLLQIFKERLSVWRVGEAMDKIAKVQDVKILNDFARILGKIDPLYLINSGSIYTRADVLMYLFHNSDFKLFTNLFAVASNSLKDLPLDAIFSKNNIKILSCTSLLGKLDPEMANFVISNYAYMNKSDLRSMLAISSKCTDLKLRENIIKAVFNKNLDLEQLPSLLYRYWYHPETKEIDNYIIDLLKQIVPSSELKGTSSMIDVINSISKLDINNHIELYNTIIALTKNLVLYNVSRLKFILLDKLLSLAHKNLLKDLDFAYIIQKCQIANNSEAYREKVIEKIKAIGLSDKNAVLTICNKQDSFSSAYLSETISCLADLRFEQDNWAKEMAMKLIDYAEDKKIAFESNAEYINWIYGMVTFQDNKSLIMRHIENSKYFECKLPTFKHLLLENHFNMHPDYKGAEFLEKNTLQYLRDKDYFGHFGIDKLLISLIESSLNKENIEVKIGTFLDGIWIPFYIPSARAALWPVTNSVLLYRSKKIRGEFAMYRTQMLKNIKDLILLDEGQINKIEVGGIRQFFKS